MRPSQSPQPHWCHRAWFSRGKRASERRLSFSLAIANSVESPQYRCDNRSKLRAQLAQAPAPQCFWRCMLCASDSGPRPLLGMQGKPGTYLCAERQRRKDQSAACHAGQMPRHLFYSQLRSPEGAGIQWLISNTSALPTFAHQKQAFRHRGCVTRHLKRKPGNLERKSALTA